jgi:hypothetical protein
MAFQSILSIFSSCLLDICSCCDVVPCVAHNVIQEVHVAHNQTLAKRIVKEQYSIMTSKASGTLLASK